MAGRPNEAARLIGRPPMAREQPQRSRAPAQRSRCRVRRANYHDASTRTNDAAREGAAAGAFVLSLCLCRGDSGGTLWEGCNGRGKQAAIAAAFPLRLPRSALKGEIRQDFVLQCTPCLPPLRGGTIDFKYFLELCYSSLKLCFRLARLRRISNWIHALASLTVIAA